jgi:hypothetical protein
MVGHVGRRVLGRGQQWTRADPVGLPCGRPPLSESAPLPAVCLQKQSPGWLEHTLACQRTIDQMTGASSHKDPQRDIGIILGKTYS